ncbi:hypothetical protein I4U23_012354 [Adineta vaga]|nr:hypothetical protein I4U23_012354 [Adineta vaga]
MIDHRKRNSSKTVTLRIIAFNARTFRAINAGDLLFITYNKRYHYTNVHPYPLILNSVQFIVDALNYLY